MLTAVIRSKSKPGVKFQYGGLGYGFLFACSCSMASSQSHLPHCRVLPSGEFNGMSSESHVSHCRVLPLGEFTVLILDLATCHIAGCSHLAKLMSWSCHIAGCNNSIRHIENRFHHILFCVFLNAVWALTRGGFRIVSDTLVLRQQSC